MNSEQTPSRLPSYKTNDPIGWCGSKARGAAMGRADIVDEDAKEYAGEIHLRRIYLSGDYDCNGTYWGCGDPLYWYANKEGTIDCMTRAKGREDARRIVLEHFPKAKVRR